MQLLLIQQELEEQLLATSGGHTGNMSSDERGKKNNYSKHVAGLPSFRLIMGKKRDEKKRDEKKKKIPKMMMRETCSFLRSFSQQGGIPNTIHMLM